MSTTEHFSLGGIAATVGLQKNNLMRAVKLGIGATAAITLGDLLQSKVLVKNGAPMIPTTWAPVVHALFGIMGGAIVGKKINVDVGTGMVAGGVGLGVSALIGQAMSRTMGASAATAKVAEDQGSAPQAVSGFGLGRAFAPSMSSLAGLGRVVHTDPAMLFGVGTPDMSAAGMFSGATTAIEDGSGSLHGKTIAFEDSGSRLHGFAAAFT